MRWSNIFKALIVFFLGVGGALWGEMILFPWLLSTRTLFLPQTERQVLIFPKEEIVIEENKALQEAVEKVREILIIKENTTGYYLTSDGVFFTLSPIKDLEPLFEDKDQGIFFYKERPKNPITPLPFAKEKELYLGKRVFLLQKTEETEEIIVGYLRAKRGKEWILSFNKEGVVFNAEGEMVGIARKVSSQEESILLPSSYLEKVLQSL